MNNRPLIIFLLIGAIVVVIISIIFSRLKPSPNQIITTPIISPTSQKPLASVTIATTASNQTAINTKEQLLPKLPIVLNDFPTSVGINTEINISSYESDDPDVVKIEIYNLDYQYNQNDPNTNPNMIAYKESFLKARDLLSQKGVDINNLHISLSNKKYIRDIAEGWLNYYNLLK